MLCIFALAHFFTSLFKVALSDGGVLHFDVELHALKFTQQLKNCHLDSKNDGNVKMITNVIIYELSIFAPTQRIA
ncbi:hypothetical protein D1115_06800 [Vibrio alfacsensis]|uniref:Secreted protein n=1 Tax=Vibrio alfacsensis TaxID=1074311 RepID=A0ABM6YTK5_9VIBR|nr:hypothetical protein [Vibrio alfacsensis]AXY00982.1 hypothetical protein D1115_06800 [Vibrio alfacsensis]